MPTFDRRQSLSHDEALTRAGEAAFPQASGREDALGIGLEPELFPIFVDSAGRPEGRVPLRDKDGRGVLEIIDGLACREPEVGSRSGGPLGPWEYGLRSGGRLTFEPGAQVEHSTAVHAGIAAAVDDVQHVVGVLRTALRSNHAVLAACGIDLWHDVDTVPQQLPFGRYVAQARYYERRGPWGKIMMRHTASLQINLDLGREGIWQERWLVANLISPLITATFACSPGPDAVSARAKSWQSLDPTRSGFPGLLVSEPGSDPRLQWGQAALNADVMLFRVNGGRWEPGDPGFTFDRWLADGHPEFGWPTARDLDYHLTTLFFEVRARGFLELRAGEAVPDALRPAEVALVSVLLYDDLARSRVIELLADRRADLQDLWERAASTGVRDAELCDLAARIWEWALRGAERMPPGYVGDRALEAARGFLEDFTFKGRTPAEHIRELHQRDPALSLAWAASEPEVR
jgi:glutamate--cysteine ligase